MPTQLRHIASRVFGRPLLLTLNHATLIAHVLADRLVEGGLDVPMGEAELSRFRGEGKGRITADGYLEEWYRVVGNTGVVTVDGETVNRGAWIGTDSGLVAYEAIDAQLRKAASDPDVKSLVMDLNTPGGEPGGITALGRTVRAIAAEKPVVAFANAQMDSAGYWMASGASTIVAAPDAEVGSIGYWILHFDRSEQYAKKGIKPTLIFKGAHKVDANPFGPLPDGVRSDLEAEAEKVYSLFLDEVAAGRGARTTREMARATEARIYIGEDAVKAGLADRVGSLDEIFADLSHAGRTFAGFNPQGGRKVMSKTPNENEDTIPRADHDAAVAKAKADGKAEGVTEGAAAERKRVADIMGLDEAVGREAQAGVLIAKGVDVDTAKALLAASPASDDASVAARSKNDPVLTGADGKGGKQTSGDMWSKALAKHGARFATAAKA